MSTTTDQISNPSLNQGASSDAPARVGLAKLAPAQQSDHVVPAVTVSSQVTVGTIMPVDRRTLEGSTPGDFRSQAAQPNPLAGNDTPVRGETEQAGG